MEKKCMALVFIVFFICLVPSQPETYKAVKSSDKDTAIDNNKEWETAVETFIKIFKEALKTNDQVKMEAFVLEAGPHIVYYAVTSQANKGLASVGEGKDGRNYFNTAEAMAVLYAKEFKKVGLLELVRKYKLYNYEMVKEKARGDKFMDEGYSFYLKGKLDEALKRITEALEIFEKIEDFKGKANALNNIGIFYQDLGKGWEALDYFQKVVEINRKIGYAIGEADAIYNIGIVYSELGMYREALRFCQQAYEIYRNIGDIKGEANVFHVVGTIYSELGKYSEALKYNKQALEINRNIMDVRGEANALLSIGGVYQELSKYSEALGYYQLALDIYQKAGDTTGEASALNNIGMVYQKLGEHTEALEYHQKAFEIYRKIRFMKGEAKSLNSIGVVNYELGRYSEALKFYQEALEIYRKVGIVIGRAGTLNNIGVIYKNLSQFPEALYYYQKALETHRMVGYLIGEAQVLSNIGVIYWSLGQYNEALYYYQKALEIDRKIGNVSGEAGDLVNIGAVNNELGRHLEALKLFQEALEIHREIGCESGEASVLSNIGIVYNKLNQYTKAISVLEESIKKSERSRVLETLWRSYRAKGEAFWKLGNREMALSDYNSAVTSIEELYYYTKGFKEEERTSMIGEKLFVYKELIELLLEMHRKFPDQDYDKQAFTVSEKAKSRAFQELMAKARARTVFAGDEVFQKMIDKEHRQIAVMSHREGLLAKELSKPEKERNIEKVNSIKEQLSGVEKSLHELEEEIETKYPRYIDLKRPKELKVEEIQEFLKPDETILAYSVGKNKSTAFAIGKDRFRQVGLAVGRKELAELINNFRRGLDNVTKLKDLERFEPEVSYTLYQKIFLPVTKELEGVNKLYISADDILYTLPFEALVDREIDIKAFREARKQGRRGQGAFLGEYATLHFLIDAYTITYLPSASVLRSLRKYEKPGYGEWLKPLIALADPVFSLDELNLGEGGVTEDEGMEQKGISQETKLAKEVLIRSTGGATLKRLKESAQEAEAIAEEVKGEKEDIYLRERASEKNIHTAELKKARYLLFSTHGFLGGDFSGVAEPSLALTLVNNPPGIDGFLTMSEVLGLDLNAEVVVLSACNTYGRAEKAGRGEGFVGLARSFMYAGTKSVLLTHWSVESQAARDLMVDTFKKMKKEARSKALRDSKLWMRSIIRDSPGTPNGKLSLSHPFFWAPFVLVGEGK